MDKEIRNRIQRATQDTRALLEREYAEQLEGVFDIRLDGTMATEPGAHLDAEQGVVRDKLVAAVEHRRAGGFSRSEAVAAYRREAAFTTLNRFVALKMLEARGLVQECISHGEQSAGFKEFMGLAPGLVQLSDHGYRLYIESLFDEIGREVQVLFDRRDPASLLWPRRQALLDLLALLNALELTEVWKEDETAGWVYQYFNSDEERRKMRAESQAPRNSHELAVRNQFFTPRYVVEFLTDNTLGRIWYEMRHGKTQLVDECDYLVRRPTEIFLAEGKEPPAEVRDDDENLSQEKLFQRPVYIPFRLKKDPRDLKILDPACGSGHFLLYAFDLLVTIYEEGWEDEYAPKSELTGRTLREDYPSLAALPAALPGLILRHNLHGIDIDPRAAQIAALALWMRAQRAYNDFGIARGERFPIRRTNIVVAEPMPGENEIRQEFIASLDKSLGELVERVFEKMEFAGEAGTLLKIEGEIQSAIRDIYGETGEMFRKSDKKRWQEAEQNLLTSLRNYAEQAMNGRMYQRRLFVEDAARGFAFIDLCQQQYDTVLMNPPFGAHPRQAKTVIDDAFPASKPDILCAFIERASQLLGKDGFVGAITNRTVLFGGSMRDWRVKTLLGNCGLRTLADFGHGVLDEALVETAAYILGPHGSNVAFGLLDKSDKISSLIKLISHPEAAQWHPLVLDTYRHLSRNPIAYWCPPQILDRAVHLGSLEDAGILPRVGIQTSANFRFLRLQWEVPQHGLSSGTWIPFVKGGEYSPYADVVHLCIWWHDNATEQKAFCEHHAAQTGSARGNDARREFEFYFREGLTYSERTTSDISVRVLAAGCINGDVGPGIYLISDVPALAALGVLMSSAFRQLLEINVGLGDAVHSGSAARHYTVGTLAQAPFPNLDQKTRERLPVLVQECVDGRRALMIWDPTVAGAFQPLLANPSASSLHQAATIAVREWVTQCRRVLQASAEIEELVALAYGFTTETRAFIESASGGHPLALPLRRIEAKEVRELWALSEEALVDRCKDLLGASRAITKKSWWADRRVELIAAALKINADIILEHVATGVVLPFDLRDEAAGLLEYLLGGAFGDRSIAEGQWPASTFDRAWAICGRQDLGGPPVLVDDPGHELDIQQALRGQFKAIWGPHLYEEIEGEASQLLVSAPDGLRSWIGREMFTFHLRRFSRSRRKAPIYWQLATFSASYSVWLYYHRFTNDTFYKVLHDYVIPKLHHEERKLTSLVQTAGPNPAAIQRKEIARQEAFVEELRIFREEVARIAPLWNPDLNDGAIINFAPLWRLVPHHRAWQKECKDCWDQLVTGDYDWSHLAMHLWPERVVPKCAEDRSLAIAHGIEEVLWVADADGKWQPRQVEQATIKTLIQERTSAAVKEALKSLLETPAPSGGRARGAWSRKGTGGRRRGVDPTAPAASTAPSALEPALLHRVAGGQDA